MTLGDKVVSICPPQTKKLHCNMEIRLLFTQPKESTKAPSQRCENLIYLERLNKLQAVTLLCILLWPITDPWNYIILITARYCHSMLENFKFHVITWAKISLANRTHCLISYLYYKKIFKILKYISCFLF